MDFFDFCSGIGAGRIGLENNGLNCVGHAEIDKKASKTYEILFNDQKNYGDIMKIDINTLPIFDFMIAGFPCQTFSIAGKREGFEDERGKIIFTLVEILSKRRVKYFILENVKGLLSIDKGQTFETIKKMLSDAGYKIYYKVLNSINFGVPQSRERVYIVGFRNDLNIDDFVFPKENDYFYDIDKFIDKNNKEELEITNKTFLKYLSNKYNQNKDNIIDLIKMENYILDYRQSDLRKYHNFFPTLRKGRHGLLYVKNGKIKKLNGFEALALQGFPKDKIKILKNNDWVKNNDLLSQAGNAMTVNVIEMIAKKMLEKIKE